MFVRGAMVYRGVTRGITTTSLVATDEHSARRRNACPADLLPIATNLPLLAAAARRISAPLERRRDPPCGSGKQ